MAHPAEYYKQMELQDGFNHTQRIYKVSTVRLQSMVKNYWYQYCEFTQKEPLASLKGVTTNVLRAFFHWLLATRRVSKTKTLQTYWNVFCMIRKQVNGQIPIEPLLKAQMNDVRDQLAAEYGLESGGKKKPIMRAEDEFELLKTLYLSADITFDHERHRPQLALIMQLAGITGNRPSALLAVCYRDIKITLLPDPNGEQQPRVLIEIAYRETKTYRGDKDANEFGIPDVPNEPCLLLCPQVNMLALIFADHAFAAPTLTSPEQLFRLRIDPGQRQLPLPLKREMEQTPIFRRSEKSVFGYQISDSEALSDGTLRSRMLNLGSVTGMELLTGPYTFRRGNGEALDNSSYISESQRNLILQHAYSSSTFQVKYLSKYITVDTQAAYRGLEPQTALMRAASGMSRTIDPRRPRKLTNTQAIDVDRLSQVKSLHQRQEHIRTAIVDRYGSILKSKGTEEYAQYQKACEAHRKEKRRRGKMRLREVQARYTVEQPVADIERQLSGAQIATAEPSRQEGSLTFTERHRVINALLTFATSSPEQETSSPEEECRRRSEAIRAVTALCSKSGDHNFFRTKASSKLAVGHDTILDIDIEASKSHTYPAIECKPTQCIFCLGREEYPPAKRHHTFYSRGDLQKHLNRQHLSFHQDGKTIVCPHLLCSTSLTTRKQIQSHAKLVHKTLT